MGMSFICPNCDSESNSLVIPVGGKLGCRMCVEKPKNKFNVNLGQTLDSWTHVDKKGKEHKHRVSVGKNWELEQRRISLDDNTVVVNKATGRESQY